MANEQVPTNETEPKNELTVEQEYLAQIESLKSTTVSKDEYDKLRKEHSDLLDAYVNGTREINAEQPAAEEFDIEKCRNEMFSGRLSNIEYVKHAQDLRKELMKKGEPDPYLPIGSQIQPTDEDIKIAEKVAKVYDECLEIAKGDDAIFTNELMRRTVDTPVPQNK